MAMISKDGATWRFLNCGTNSNSYKDLLTSKVLHTQPPQQREKYDLKTYEGM